MVERVLTDEMVKAIEAYFPRYPTRRAVTLPALHVVNDHLRHVPLQAVVEVADLLGLQPAEVQDTLSFYGFYKQDRPHGRTRIWVCRSISCALRGADDLLEYLADRLGIRPGETTEDGAITLEFAECLGACEHAPCMLAGERLCGCMIQEQIDQVLDSLLEGKNVSGAS
ncbi:MAG: NAD(P)H-dependent oxidoreductase subunit E [Pirellulaceae bacterium]